MLSVGFPNIKSLYLKNVIFEKGQLDTQPEKGEGLMHIRRITNGHANVNQFNMYKIGGYKSKKGRN